SYEITSGALRGMGYSILPTALTVIGSCLFRIAWVFVVLPHFQTFRSIVIVYPISWAFTGIMVLTAYAIVCHRQKKGA
ncbi:MAG: MATE family efflux transporter, partial [Firmicutes bacterium]|nr:MATE family efflux transporter [Bacillota bacterium]